MVLGVLYVIPSLVLMILLLPLLGLNERTVIVALVIYCQIILVRNVIAGLSAIDPSVMEAAQGLGMTPWQQFVRVQLPLASSVIIAGVRLAALGVGPIVRIVTPDRLNREIFNIVDSSFAAYATEEEALSSGRSSGCLWMVGIVIAAVTLIALAIRSS